MTGMNVVEQSFTTTFLNCIQPGHHVLNLGAGEGKFAQMFVERGASVTMVDTQLPKIQDANVHVQQMSIEEFCAIENPDRYDGIFARNSIQFLDKNWVHETLFPWLEDHSSDNGIIAIETFFQNPEPPFNRHMKSLYALKELQSHFLSWNEMYAREYSHLGLDMSGQTRKFFVSSLIVQKPHE